MNIAIETRRYHLAACIILSGSTLFLCYSKPLPAVSAPPSKSPASPTKPTANASLGLHDGGNTVNPWAYSPQEFAGFRETLLQSQIEIREDPRNPENYITRADSYVKLMMPNEALKDANAALALKPQKSEDLAAAYYLRGEALLQLKRYKQALDDLEKGCELDPHYGEPYYFRGMAKEKLGQLPAALKDYQMARLLRFSKGTYDIDFSGYMNDLQARVKRAWAPPKGNESKRVVVVFKVNRDGSLSKLRLRQGCGLAVADAAALKAVKDSAPWPPLPKGSPRNVDIDFTLDYNSFSKGMRTIGDSSDNGYNNAAALAHIQHSTLQRLLTQSEAEKKLVAAMKGKDDQAILSAELGLANLYAETGKYDKAIELFHNAMKKMEGKRDEQQEYGVTLGKIATVHSRQNKNAEAETEFKKSLELVDKGPDSLKDRNVADILQEYAKVLYKTHKNDEANRIYERLKPTKP